LNEILSKSEEIFEKTFEPWEKSCMNSGTIWQILGKYREIPTKNLKEKLKKILKNPKTTLLP
jgi:hypothetical protein